MSDPRVRALPVPGEALFDRTPVLAQAGPAEPLVYDAAPLALRQRTVNFAAKRLTDMVYVSEFSPAEAQSRLRWRAAAAPGGLQARPAATALQAVLDAAVAAGQLAIQHDAAARSVTVTWTDPGFGPAVRGRAVAPAGYGGIVLGSAATLGFDPVPVPRAPAVAYWTDTAADQAPAVLRHAADTFLSAAPGAYGMLVAAPGRVLFERYAHGGAPDRVTPSWSMTKSITATVIGRMIHLGWLRSVQDPAPAPLWTDPRGAHAGITIEHLLRMRAGLGMPVLHGDGSSTLGFENSAVYQDATDAFTAAQRNIVATLPGSVFRYVNAGPNVLGAIIRQEIERRGLAYPATLYALLVDKIGMASFQHSADIAGNMIASGAGFATLRDYAKLGLLYVQDGVWNGERLLPEGWADYALAPSHAGTNYAASFWTNAQSLFPDLPPDIAWASGASDQRTMIFRRHGLVAVITNETDHPMDLGRLNTFLATALAVF